ncbi:DUF6894 family protein [Brevundimonas sp.]|jgi:hypothetical protein|uniref:DUF6894 family protein n=1 Tax=Brevundimonas sp. TaxID=1871086 RepID=UPI002E127C31
MASYHYAVTGIAPPTHLTVEAVDDRSANRDAVRFLAELLRDLAVSDCDGSGVRVEVRNAGGDLLGYAVASWSFSADMPDSDGRVPPAPELRR